MDSFLCPICNAPLFQKPPATGEEDAIDLPTKLKDVPCCTSSTCGHLAHCQCLGRSLAQNADAGCPVCHQKMVVEECAPVRLPAPSTSSANGSGDAFSPGGGTVPVSTSRTRTTSVAFGQVNAVNTGVKVPRTTGSSLSGETDPAATATPLLSASSASGSLAPVAALSPIPTFREQVLETALKGGPNLSDVLTPELCRQCDEQLQRILPNGQALHFQQFSTNMSAHADRMDAINAKYLGQPLQQKQFIERFALAAANRFLEVDADEARENMPNLAILSEAMAEFNRWWDAQNF